MFNVGDMIIYSTHGLCKIDDICEKKFRDKERTYYVMHPVKDPNLTISAPVEDNQTNMWTVMNKEEAKEILHSFQFPGVEWIDNARERNKKYTSYVHTGNRQKISNILNTLMKREIKAKENGHKVSDLDHKLLESVQNIMFSELAVSLDTTYEEIASKVNNMIRQTV
ncbi:CarD family transcriptional regulator [Gracilibacillus dipsosauri]|uniref:CarD family transcriptional regulator n=1 Tax=Gracilibacillus dipsosauri TaxID=178340 RepID=A0A317L394_9BACI|nr:CarD family transcriptional regulator [Gracilibacillus dipsosauri]PWU70351.1 CarD family transcriptional regulator [Gracilibacillus dipsosauri]